MISIKKLLSQNDTDDTLLRVLNLLLHGMVIHTVEGDADDRSVFCATLADATSILNEQPRGPEYMVQAGIILQALGDYSRRTTRLFHQRTLELQNMVGMLTKTVQSMTAASEENIGRLKQIEQQIVSVTQIKDVRVLRATLETCLTEIRQETERQRLHTERSMEEVQGNLKLGHGVPEAQRTPAEDPVTGLPGRSAAEKALAGAIAAETPAYAAVLAVDRIPTYNVSFGFEVGDQVLMTFAGYVRRKLREGQEAFRWTGPALMVLISRANRIETVRTEIGTLMEHKFEHTVRTPTRTIHLPIATRWTVFPMMPTPQLLIHKIDSFVSQTSPQEF